MEPLGSDSIYFRMAAFVGTAELRQLLWKNPQRCPRSSDGTRPTNNFLKGSQWLFIPFKGGIGPFVEHILGYIGSILGFEVIPAIRA